MKRFLGWQPSKGDNIEWDETERLWMLALQIYEEQTTCPLCGNPISFCHDEDAVERAFKGGEVQTCFVTQLREQTAKQFQNSGEVLYPGAQTVNLIPRK